MCPLSYVLCPPWGSFRFKLVVVLMSPLTPSGQWHDEANARQPKLSYSLLAIQIGLYATVEFVANYKDYNDKTVSSWRQSSTMMTGRMVDWLTG